MDLKSSRISWQDYFMGIAALVAQRSTCLRRKVGAVAVKDLRILATGYNGAPKRVPHCLDVGCLREQLGIPSGERHELCAAVHGEQNVIIQAASYGVSLDGADLYCTHKPCFICAKMLVNVGIKTIITTHVYPDENTDQLFHDAGVRLLYI